MSKHEFFPCDAENFSKVYHSKVTEEQEERTAKALKEYRQRKELPETLKKAEKTLSELHSECIQAAGDEVLRGTNDWTNLQQTKLIPSQVVASEWDKREKEFASFLEIARKELQNGKCLHDNAMPKRCCMLCFVAVLGEERK